jgi:hypothetical protein
MATFTVKKSFTTGRRFFQRWVSYSFSPGDVIEIEPCSNPHDGYYWVVSVTAEGGEVTDFSHDTIGHKIHNEHLGRYCSGSDVTRLMGLSSDLDTYLDACPNVEMLYLGGGFDYVGWQDDRHGEVIIVKRDTDTDIPFDRYDLSDVYHLRGEKSVRITEYPLEFYLAIIFVQLYTALREDDRIEFHGHTITLHKDDFNRWECFSSNRKLERRPYQNSMADAIAEFVARNGSDIIKG